LEDLDIDVPDLLLGTSLQIDNPAENHYFGAVHCQPNYLYMCCFEKMGSVYSVSIQSRSPVRFGEGGSTEIDIVKRGDSMVVKQYFSNSIN